MGLFKTYSEKEVKRVMPIVTKINELEESISKLTDIECPINRWHYTSSR